MKRLCLPMLLLVCLLLSGCGGKAAKKDYEEFSQELAAKTELSFTAALRAEYEDKTVDFTLQYEQTADGATVTVTAPDIIAGVKAQFSNGKTSLEYDGVIIDTGELDDYGLTPMSALPVLVDAMINGHVDSFWTEDGKTVYQLIPSDYLTATVWFEPDTMTPTRAELLCEGRLTVCCEIENWS